VARLKYRNPRLLAMLEGFALSTSETFQPPQFLMVIRALKRLGRPHAEMLDSRKDKEALLLALGSTNARTDKQKTSETPEGPSQVSDKPSDGQTLVKGVLARLEKVPQISSLVEIVILVLIFNFKRGFEFSEFACSCAFVGKLGAGGRRPGRHRVAAAEVGRGSTGGIPEQALATINARCH
jgi:hypothetical protein